MTPLLSIVIPIYNSERQLRACLDSVLSQELREIEVLCIDNGSSDGSVGIVNAYAQKDRRVRSLTAGVGKGAGSARNAGILMATGKWLHFIDSDDILLPGAAKRIVDFAEENNTEVVVFDAEEYDDATGFVTGLPLDLTVQPKDDAFLRAYSTCPWNKIFRSSFIKEANIKFQEIKRVNDLAFTVEALCRAKKIAILNQTLYRYRIHGGGSLQDSKHETPLAWQDALEEAKGRLVRAGIFDEYQKAFDILLADVRLANTNSFWARIIASIRRRGIGAFLKHACGVLVKRFKA